MAEKRAKRSEPSEHNTDHKNERTPDNITKPKKTKTGASRPEHNADHKNEQTPDNRPKAKAKTGPSPKRNTDALPTVPPFPTGEKASGSQDKPKNNNPESEHELKGNPGRPRNNQGPKSNNQGPPPVRKDIFKETPKAKAKAKANPIPIPNPKHDTDVDNNTDF